MGELAPGAVFAGHRIDRLAGRGGMGVVYRATHLALERTVALKVIAPSLVEDASTRQRFLRESKLAASIDHPNVIPVYYAGEEDGVAYIAMRFVAGQDLRSLVREHGGLEPARAARIVAQVGAALDAAHATGLVHRDVKPANVLLGPSDHVYLSDFGLSKHTLSSDGETRSGHWVGTLDYVAPEQIRGERLDARCDVYALGGVLYFALTGRAPFPREGDEAKLWAQLTELPPRAREHAPRVPSALDDVIARALAKRPDERYPSAGDLGRAALAAVGEPGTRRPERAVGVGAAAPDETPTETASRVTPAPAPSRRRRLPAAAVAGTIGALAAAVAAVALLTGGGAAARHGASTTSHTAHTATAAPKLVGAVRIGGRPNAIAVAGGTVFVTTRGDPHVRLIDEATLRLRPSRPTVGAGAVAIATGAGAVWVAVNGNPAVYALDPATGRRRARIALPMKPKALAVGHGSLWVGMISSNSGTSDQLARVDPRTHRIIRTFPVPKGVQGLVSTPQGVWVLHRLNPGLARFDARLERFEKRVVVGRSALGAAAWGAGSLWVTSPQEDSVNQIDDKSGQKVVIGVGRRPTGIAARGSQVWVTSLIDHTISRIEPAASSLAGRPVRVPLNPYALTLTADSVWLTALGRGEVARVRYRAAG